MDERKPREVYLDCGGQTYQGPIFDSKEAAEQHGLELAKTGLISGPNVERPNRQS